VSVLSTMVSITAPRTRSRFIDQTVEERCMIEARQGQGEERDVNNINVGPSPKQLDPFLSNPRSKCSRKIARGHLIVPFSVGA